MAYTSIDDPSAYFQVKTYSGTGSTTSITNDGNSNLQPDWIWIKKRTIAASHMIADSTRGTTKYLSSDGSDAESTATNRVTAFNSDGFSLGNAGSVNNGSHTYVAWQWKANGGTTSSNTDGTITTTVQANTTAGFSIITYTGNGSTGQTIGHGLGVTPDMMMVKNRSGAYNWAVYHKDSNSSPEDYYAQLNTSNAFSLATDIFGGSAATSTVIGVKNFNETNASSSNYVAYCFASKQGYSKFGKYIGNGNAEGPFVYTGFKPRWIMQKNASTNATSWFIYDSKRDTGNPLSARLAANVSDAETSATYSPFDFLSNGFKLRDGTDIWNENGSKHFYMAFAENPFVTSTGIPTTAR